VNQLLSKIDGVDQLNNILVIGMTNRSFSPITTAILRTICAIFITYKILILRPTPIVQTL
jgi:hypothetical protein